MDINISNAQITSIITVILMFLFRDFLLHDKLGIRVIHQNINIILLITFNSKSG